MFQQLPSFGPMQLCALAHLGCTRAAGTLQFLSNLKNKSFSDFLKNLSLNFFSNLEFDQFCGQKMKESISKAAEVWSIFLQKCIFSIPTSAKMWQMRVLLAKLFICQQRKIRFSHFLVPLANYSIAHHPYSL